MAIYYAISVPIWIAAIMTLLIGLVGTFSNQVRGGRGLLALALLPISSALFYTAARVCAFL